MEKWKRGRWQWQQKKFLTSRATLVAFLAKLSASATFPSFHSYYAVLRSLLQNRFSLVGSDNKVFIIAISSESSILNNLATSNFVAESETWHLISQGGSECPSARHRHTAVLHDNGLWIFGGMTDLQEKSDLWRFDFVSRKWRSLKSKPGPGCLHSHCAVKFLSVMMLFGGERDGQALNEIWRFHFGKSLVLNFFSLLKTFIYLQLLSFGRD